MNTGTKIKLLICTPTLECGGSERYVSLVCNHINTGKFDVTLVVVNNTHPFYEISNGAVEVIDLKLKHVRNSLFAIRKIAGEKQPDIIYSTANHLNLLLATFRWLFPKRILLVARESSIVSINSRRATMPELYTRLIKRFYGRIDLIICQSAWMQHDLVAHFNIAADKTAVIHNPVGGLMVQDTGNTDTGAMHIPKFITVARLSAEKGIDRLLRAVALLSFPFRYFIIGEGSERKMLEGLIAELKLQDKVVLTGEKINPYHHMNDADLFLMGSHYEGFPNALTEAGSLGIPVIAFDVPGGIREIIAEGENGVLVKDGDENAFAAAIEQALKMKFNRARIIADTKKRYSIHAVLEETEKLFIKLLTHSFHGYDFPKVQNK